VFNNLGHAITEELLLKAYKDLEGGKAIGIDGVTKDMYGQNLSSSIAALLGKIRKGTYRPKPVRIVEIPKEDGGKRPLAISCLEDKIVQGAIAMILEQIYEPVFLPCSYGFRPKRNCHGALRALTQSTYSYRDGAIIEIDIRKCFNMIPHEPLMEILRSKITDNRFLDLIKHLITVSIIEDGKAVPTKRGSPQGSIISPILANIYLHYAVDRWYTQVKRSHLEKRSELIRYADDMVFVFESPRDAERIWRVLGKRLTKCGLDLHEGKSRILASGSAAAKRAEQRGERIPTYQFLGFTCYWGKAQKGFWRLRYRSRADRFTRSLQEIRSYLREELNTMDVVETLKGVGRRVQGWLNYHAISDNHQRVGSFLHHSRRMVYKWFNRRGSHKSLKWEDLTHWLKRGNIPMTYKTISMFSTN
jgi:group II intron reverse transcriptase/maturase